MVSHERSQEALAPVPAVPALGGADSRPGGREEARPQQGSKGCRASGLQASKRARDEGVKGRKRQQPRAGPAFLMQSAGASIPPRKPRRREPGTKRGTPTAPTQACSHLPAAQGPRPASPHGRLVPHPVRVRGQVPQGFQDDSGAPGARESLRCLAHVFFSPAKSWVRWRWPPLPR